MWWLHMILAAEKVQLQEPFAESNKRCTPQTGSCEDFSWLPSTHLEKVNISLTDFKSLDKSYPPIMFPHCSKYLIYQAQCKSKGMKSIR